MSTSRSYHHGDLRAALLDATLELVHERGVEALSLREVSRRAGVSHAAAYNHFAGRAALVAACVEASFERFAARLVAARDAGSDPLDALRRTGVAYVRFAHDNPQAFKLMFRPELSGVAPEPRSATAPLPPAYAVMVGAIVRARDAGFVSGDVDALVRVAWATAHGLAALIVDGPRMARAQTVRGVERAADDAFAVLFDGMRPRPAPWP